MDYESILEEIYQQGYQKTHSSTKLFEFESPIGQVIYVHKDQAMKNGFQILVYPEVDTAALLGIPDVWLDAKFPLRSGSNMRHYPKRHSAKSGNPIQYGRSMRAGTLDGIRRLLVKIAQLPATA